MAKVGVIENTIQVISQNIKVLEDKLQNEIKQSDHSSKIFKCDHCDYNASTSTVLKRHTTSKHKGKDFSKEKEGSDQTQNVIHPPQSLLTQTEKVSMNNFTIPPFKHPDPDQSKRQEN